MTMYVYAQHSSTAGIALARRNDRVTSAHTYIYKFGFSPMSHSEMLLYEIHPSYQIIKVCKCVCVDACQPLNFIRFTRICHSHVSRNVKIHIKLSLNRDHVRSPYLLTGRSP